MTEDNERYSDPIDAGCARAEEWIADQIANHRHQMSIESASYQSGRCRNCEEKLDDGRAYCDNDCRDDHSLRLNASKRR